MNLLEFHKIKGTKITPVIVSLQIELKLTKFLSYNLAKKKNITRQLLT